MRAKHFSELRALLSDEAFRSWFAALASARAERTRTQELCDELLAQTSLMEYRSELTQKNAIELLSSAGACEDSAAQRVFEATELENRAFRAVSDFEQQRLKVSELWYRLGAVEKTLDERRTLFDQTKSKKAASELSAGQSDHRAAADEYERESARKNRLWDEVERMWEKSAEASLLVAEERARAKKAREEAEALFAIADERKTRASAIRSDASTAERAVAAAEEHIAELLDDARERFGCAAGMDFLYFLNAGDPRRALCVALVEDRKNYNLAVEPLSMFSIDHQRGIAQLEVVRADNPDGDGQGAQLETFLLKARRGPSEG